MAVEAVGSAAGFQDVLETGSIVLGDGETKARLGVGSAGGKVLLEVDPGVSGGVQPGPSNTDGLVHLRFPRLGNMQVLQSSTRFTMGTEAFKLALQIRGVDAGGQYSIAIQYTLLRD